jgi:arylsulfatase A-like enzyme
MPPDVREVQRRIFGKPITDPSYVVSAYHGETAYVDECIGAVAQKVANRGLLEDTTFIVTSDHGEIMARPRLALGRLWAFCHIGLNEDCLKLPLIIKGPDIESAQCVNERFQLIDLLPSILDLAEIASNSNLDGRSFEPALRGEKVEGRRDLFFPENTYQKQRAVLSGTWKYMRMETFYNSMPPKSLYDLRTDSLETRNLSDSRKEIVKKMDRLLDDQVTQASPQGLDPIKSQQTTARF